MALHTHRKRGKSGTRGSPMASAARKAKLIGLHPAGRVVSGAAKSKPKRRSRK